MSIEASWHLDRKTTVAVILAICANSCSFIWYAGKLDAQVQATRSDVNDLKVWREKQDDERAKINASLAVVNQKLTDQGDLIRRIDDILESGFRRPSSH